MESQEACPLTLGIYCKKCGARGREEEFVCLKFYSSSADAAACIWADYHQLPPFLDNTFHQVRGRVFVSKMLQWIKQGGGLWHAITHTVILLTPG